MASTIIHLAVANEINKVLKKDRAKILIGSIAPDLSKIVGDERNKSHFSTDNSGISNLDYFLNKYKKNLDDSFVLGYYIHLYTDYLWIKYFLSEILNGSKITKINGTIENVTKEQKIEYMYNDYTNLNVQVIEKYNLDLKLFYLPLPDIDKIIDEIPMDKLNLLIETAGIIIINSIKNKPYMFDIENVSKFIDTSAKLILLSLDELKSSGIKL